ncbi:hypothetical protein V8E36_004682 [Tilletia maclaganii]
MTSAGLKTSVERPAPRTALAMSSTSTASDIATRHLLSLLSQAEATRPRPLIVGIQGPQGIGKSTLVKNLVATLADEHRVRAVALSIDDLYLPHHALLELKQRHPSNRLLHGRGLPGTHDLELGASILSQLKNGEAASSTRTIRLPVYDKSLHNGAGDRLPESAWPTLTLPPRSQGQEGDNPPLDLFLLEGWCLGFNSLPTSDLKQRVERARQVSSASNGRSPHEGTPDLAQPLVFSLQHPQASLLELNENLRHYEREWYPHIDTFIQLWPSSPSPQQEEYAAIDAFPSQAKALVFQWRLQAEHWMKANVSEGKGMTDDQVKDFVARYMPGYELFAGGALGAARQQPHGGSQLPDLRIELDESRGVVAYGPM